MVKKVRVIKMVHLYVLCFSIFLFCPSTYGGSSSTSIEGRIMNGISPGVAIVARRSVASVRFSNLQGQFHICGGFILNKHWVGSAAQCLTGQTTQNTVVAVGTLTIVGGTSYNLNQIEMHKNYNATE